MKFFIIHLTDSTLFAGFNTLHRVCLRTKRISDAIDYNTRAEALMSLIALSKSGVGVSLDRYGIAELAPA
jgi:hypothetical protein